MTQEPNEKLEFSWIPNRVCYELEDGRNILKGKKIPFGEYHPLKPIMVVESSAAKARKRETKSRNSDTRSETKSTKSSSSNTSDFVDPLSALGYDPLSAPTPASVIVAPKTIGNMTHEKQNEFGDDFEHWSERKVKILSQFTTNEKFAITMTSIATKSGKVNQRHQSSVSDKLKDRLVQLDMDDGNKEELKNLSQQEFITKIRELQENLTTSWKTNQKVNALKLAIQSVKMLGDLSVMEFYPSKFVLVAEILNTFGMLVFDRILSMCGEMTKDSIDVSKVPENAREICMNWIMKVASIRELLPRLFVEACILPCYKFIENGDCNTPLIRLTKMIRGVGNPLVAVYARAYLCMVGVEHTPKFKGHFRTSFYDFVSAYKQLHTVTVQEFLEHRKIEMKLYMRLFTPALEWLLSCLAYNAHEDLLVEVLEKCEKTGWSLLLLNCTISAFDAEYVAPRAKQLCAIIIQSNDTFFDKNILLQSLGKKLVMAKPPSKDRRAILNEIWKYFMKLPNPQEYITCVEIWIEFAVINFKTKEINTILIDIIRHLTPDRAFEKFYLQLKSIMQKILNHMSNFEEVFAMSKFLPFLDFFQKDGVKKDVCKIVTESFIKTDATISDPVVINGLMYVCKTMHNAINAMTIDGEKREASFLINGVLHRITFGRDFEQQLNFYVECRASFYNLDGVLFELVHLVNTLSTKITRIVHGQHTKKTGAFQRACAAYCFITIPSLSKVSDRLSLYLISGQVALLNQCVAQGDAMFRASISQILEMPKQVTTYDGKMVSSQAFLEQYIANYLSALLTVPDHPDQGVLYLLRGVLNVVSGTFGDDNNIVDKHTQSKIYIRVLSLLSAFAQDKYLYKIKGVDSNEDLYSGSNEFIGEVTKIGTMLLDPILGYLLTTTKSKQDEMERSSVCWSLFHTITGHADVAHESTRKLIVIVWDLAMRDKSATTKYKVEVLESLKRRGSVYKKIASLLPLTTMA